MKRYTRKDQAGSTDNDYLVHLFAHKNLVSKYMSKFIVDLSNRSANHDDSKAFGLEKDMFVGIGVVDGSVEYQSEEYKENMGEANTALALAKHYSGNDHHPEHHTNGIDDMDLVQLIEMICDWKVGGLAYEDGDIFDSIEKNIDRFGLDEQLSTILKNTAERYLRSDL